MKIKTSELTGAALDWAVAKCEGNNGVWYVSDRDAVDFTPSSDWAQGGPIIEREAISVLHTSMRPSHSWEASQTPNEDISVCAFGPTPLIAALRCYVASKLGDEVNVPEELSEVAL